MFDLNAFINLPPFSLSKSEKEPIYSSALDELTKHHYAKCSGYRKILDALEFDLNSPHSIENLPFIPVSLFKDFELCSVEKEHVIKTMTSSGTTGQKVSRIFLDRTTATYQTKCLMKIVSSFVGTTRRPMLIIDSSSVVKDRNLFSARGAGMLGFSMFGRDVTYALDDSMDLNWEVVESFCDKHKNETILIFGFTFLVWEFFYKEMVKHSRRLPLDNAILIHGGGWKKLSDQAVDSGTFKLLLEKMCGIKRIHNYYGMVEQTGSIFMECEFGYLHSSIFSDVLVRRPDFSLSNKTETGVIELVSLLPWSYPGHVLLSEDRGQVFGEDDCACGRRGKYFKIFGRLQSAEIRGCSDTFE